MLQLFANYRNLDEVTYAILIPTRVWTSAWAHLEAQRFSRHWTRTVASGKSRLPKEIYRELHWRHIMEYFSLFVCPLVWNTHWAHFNVQWSRFCLQSFDSSLEARWMTFWYSQKARKHQSNTPDPSWRYCDAGITVRLEKCEFSSNTILCLGHILQPEQQAVSQLPINANSYLKPQRILLNYIRYWAFAPSFDVWYPTSWLLQKHLKGLQNHHLTQLEKLTEYERVWYPDLCVLQHILKKQQKWSTGTARETHLGRARRTSTATGSNYATIIVSSEINR